MYDRDGDGKIESIDKMFGNNTKGPDGKKSVNGFEALKKYDANGDGFISAEDPIFAKLKLWVDANYNGVADPGELRPLSESGVEAIDLGYQEKTEMNDFYGNATLERSVVVLKDKSIRRIYDLWVVPGDSERPIPAFLVPEDPEEEAALQDAMVRSTAYTSTLSLKH